jgi:tetratricopeptide (TPR) repeat protein
MRATLSTCLLFLCTAGLTAKEPTLQEARLRWLKGNYAEALDLYKELAEKEKTRVDAALGISRCLQSEGEYDKALDTIDALLKDQPPAPRLLARRAELLYLRGRWDDAEKAAESALKGDKEQFLARWVRAQVWRDRGDLKKADAEFKWFVTTYSERVDTEKEIKDPETLLIIGLASSENARWHRLANEFEAILQDIYGDIRKGPKGDKDFWPAEYQIGMLLLEKYNRREGIDALNKALVINPSAAEALVGKGVAALQRVEYAAAERFAEEALKINPNLPEALRLRADVYLAGGQTDKALQELDTARKVNPRDEQTLGRVAACLWLLRKNADLEALLKEVGTFDPTPGLLHLVLAERLEDRRRYGEAEKHFRKARELRPVLHQATTNLGMLCMRLGREQEATKLLSESFKADPFNVRVSNMRKVLEHLEKYETLQTDHFILRYDPQRDTALARYMGDYLEKVYAELAEKFNHRPQGRILIEVFNNHQMFSGRTVALPDLHTIGACTGRMVAMVSPKGKGLGKPFNWARVLRHELVHIFNLDQTHFLVPHWFTEGLAVGYEGFDRPQQWNQLLLTREPAGKLMTLDNIDLGFIRPRDLLDWGMAYCQAELYVEYLTKAHGKAAVSAMLDAYRDGLSTAEAIKKVCKVDKAAFEKGYRDHLEGVVKSLGGKPGEKPMSFQELKAAHDKDPKDLDVTARLAEENLRRNRVTARKLAEQVLLEKKNHPRASYVMARLATLGGDADRARALLESAVDPKEPDAKVVRTLGKMYYDAGEMKQAAEMFELGRKAEPYDSEWLTLLARVYARLEDREKQIVVLKGLVKADADDLESRKRLARLLAAAGKHAEAEQYARTALEIDVTDKEARESLYKALEEQKKDAELERVKKLLEK